MRGGKPGPRPSPSGNRLTCESGAAECDGDTSNGCEGQCFEVILDATDILDWVRVVPEWGGPGVPGGRLWHDNYLLVGYASQRSLVKWSLGDIPENAVVDSAVLELYGDSVRSSSGSVYLDFVADDTWSCGRYISCDGAYTVSQLYGWPTEARVSSYPDSGVGWTTVDVTSVVQSESAGDDVLSLKWDYSTEWVFERYVTTGTQGPHIDVTYHVPD